VFSKSLKEVNSSFTVLKLDTRQSNQQEIRMNNLQKLALVGLSSCALVLPAIAQTTVVMEKRNTSFSIDGGEGAANNRQVYLWNTNTGNVNQQWEETFIAPKYYSYKKKNTNHCLDGGNGAVRGQPVKLYRCISGEQNQHWEKIPQANGTFRLKKRGFSFSIDCNNGGTRRQACYLWNSGDSNVNQHFSFKTIGSGGGEGAFGLDPNLPPWGNFDLKDWALDAPNADPDDGLSARTTDRDFANGNLFNGSAPFFFTGSDGAMVFKSPVNGAKTSSNTSYPRSELREMLRRGNTSISTTGVNANNWALGYQPVNSNIGARGGKLTATLRVNQVTSTGSSSQVGRVIIGQIHAAKDEPVRLYYRKLPGNSKGSVYWVHEIRNGDDLDEFVLVGSASSSASNPSNGIALNELFSYEIINNGANLEVILRRGDRNGPIIGRESMNMNTENSGYNRSDEWMYFKAGAYTQNNTGNGNDYDQVSFYRLDNSH
jgi:hypothetical protein